MNKQHLKSLKLQKYCRYFTIQWLRTPENQRDDRSLHATVSRSAGEHSSVEVTDAHTVGSKIIRALAIIPANFLWTFGHTIRLCAWQKSPLINLRRNNRKQYRETYNDQASRESDSLPYSQQRANHWTTGTHFLWFDCQFLSSQTCYKDRKWWLDKYVFIKLH